MDIQRLPRGKSEDRSGNTHRLEHHCADVAACFEALIREPVLRQRLAQAAGVRVLDDVNMARLVVLVFLHDFGKIRPELQVGPVRGGRGRPSHLNPVFWAYFSRTGVNRDIGLDQLREWGPGAEQLIHAVLAHHGRPVIPYEWKNREPADIWKAIDGYDPIKAGREMVGLARRWFPEAFEPGPDLPASPVFVHLCAGIVVLADHIGSNDELFRQVPVLERDYIDRARAKADDAVRAFGFTRSDWAERTGPATFQTLFPEWEPRPLQTAVVDAPLHHRLLILESETGSGKTEAALMRFAILFKEGLVDSLYFALPTRAAAKQIQERIHKALGRFLPDAARADTVLAIPGYIVRVGEVAGKREGWSVLWRDDPNDDDRLARWAAESARKFLCATVAVGTVDQALLAGLQVKWAHFRGAALARSLLVVDEVHASDDYMTKVMSHVLRNHLSAGGHALLMSATLGTAARRRIVSDATGTRTDVTSDTPYPMLTMVSGNGEAETATFEHAGKPKRVSMTAEPIIERPGAVGALAVQHATEGAKVLVVRNTVAQAVAVFDAIRESSPDSLLQVVGGPALHHSRFAAEDRRLLDAAVERELGAERGCGGLIVVGTQTLEQSLDIDADVLISDLCPADVLLQRIGRLHRHSNERPDGFDTARCHVLVPPGELDSDGLLRFGLGISSRNGRGIYLDITMLKLTRRAVVNHPVWIIPDMNRMLVDGATDPERLAAVEKEMGWRDKGNEVDGKTFADRLFAEEHSLSWEEKFSTLGFPKDEKVRTRLGDDGFLFRLPEPVQGPLGMATTFNLPAHMFPEKAKPEEIEHALAEPGPDGLILVVGPHRFIYDRGGVRKGRTH